MSLEDNDDLNKHSDTESDTESDEESVTRIQTNEDIQLENIIDFIHKLKQFSTEHLLEDNIDSSSNNTVFNKTCLNPTHFFCCIGVGHTVYYIYMNIYDILKFIYILFAGLSICLSTFSITCMLLDKYEQKNELEEEEELSEEEKLDLFIHKDYDELKEIFKNPEMKENEYENHNESYINCLSNVENHFTSDLPYEYSNTIKMFYNSKDNCYYYYSKSSDIQYKVLNSVCRSYVLNKKCLHLFRDDEDLKRIQMMVEESESEDVSDYENISEEEEEEEEEGKEEETEQEKQEETGGGFLALFYSKGSVQKKKEELKKMNEKQINKFIHKGNLLDYEKEYVKSNKTIKEIDYQEYKNLQEQKIKQS